jgi:hypothetical protein
MSESSNSYNMGFSSRIKKIFIELHGYTFFHGPSEMKHIDKRFIGRLDIINKLKAILINSDTRSGSYLVTGYRGMGKSSFVGKVIDDIDPNNRRSIPASRYGRILVLLLFSSLLTISNESVIDVLLLIIAPAILWITMWSFLIKSSRTKNTLKNTESEAKEIKKADYLSWRILKSFLVSSDADSEYVFRRFIRVIFISMTIYLTTIIIEYFFIKEASLGFRLISFSIQLLLLMFFNSMHRIIKEHSRPINGNKKQLNFKKSRILALIWSVIKRKIKNFFNYSRRVYIKLNLGYDDLREIDILRLISRNIEREYKKFMSKRSKKWPFLLFQFIFFYLLAGISYYYTPIFKMTNDLKETIGIIEYLPSQSEEILEQKILSVAESTRFQQLEKLTKSLDRILFPSIFAIAAFRISSMNPEIQEGLFKYLTVPEYVFIQGETLKNAIKYIDGVLYRGYDQFQKLVPLRHSLFAIDLFAYLSIKPGAHQFKLLPYNLDYLFLLYLLGLFLLNKFFIRPIFKSSSNESVLRKLKKLNEIIDYQITYENGTNLNTNMMAFSFFNKKTKNQPQATIREIEKHLIEIFENLDRFSKFSIKPEFVFIFDELDKIEPHKNISISQRESEEPDILDQPETTYFATEGVRKRQHTIFKILSNLKHFLNTAKAKFIFIAGRELYDAALADVSDRNFFIGSIFHDVIYVNSFMTDLTDNKSSDIASMTEQYVCQFLFPPYFQANEFSLKEYRRFLDKYYNGEADGNIKIEKIIYTLRNFITYLTYRSNGAPKKMTNYFENYIYKPERKENLTSDLNLCVGFNHRNLYLRFGYFEQYTFGMISYLVMPVILSVSESIKDYGDKLLVSTSFLVDHLYKFHKNGFSWRNIELTPEIVDINKAPQLREFITKIINSLSNTHLMEIVKGFYDFKFRRKISEEIDFLSKIEEREAAAFNFTLDESLSLKRHHKKLLQDLKLSHKNKNIFRNREEYINSISFIHMIIGDLHFYDEEYNDAIIEYMEATEELRKIKFNALNASYFLLFVRNMLKLGFTLEKRKSYSSAFMIYGQLVAAIINFRDIDLSTLGLRQKIIKKENINEFLSKAQNLSTAFKDELAQVEGKNKNESIELLVKDDSLNSELRLSSSHLNNPKAAQLCQERYNNFHEQIEPVNVDLTEDRAICLAENFRNLIHNTDAFSKVKENLLFKISAFEGIRIIFQPLQAKFQMIEKSNLGGVTTSDLIRIENEFQFMIKTIKHKEKYLIEAEFWGKIGDILYFKNGLNPIQEDQDGDLSSQAKEQKPAKENYYCENPDAFCSRNSDIRENYLNESYLPPCKSCEYYMRSMQGMIENFAHIEENKKKHPIILPYLFYKCINHELRIKQSLGLQVLANLLSGIGNNFLSCCTINHIPSPTFLQDFLSFVERPEKNYLSFFTAAQTNPDQLNDENEANKAKTNKKIKKNVLEAVKINTKEFNKIEEVFLYYYLSYWLYMQSGQPKEASIQILKILYVIRNLLRMQSESEEINFIESTKSQIDKIKSVLFTHGIKNLNQAYGSVHHLETEIYKDIFNNQSNENNSQENVKYEEKTPNTSLSADYREFYFVVKEIELICMNMDEEIPFEIILRECNVTPYSTINRMYNRIIELRFKAQLNYRIFKKLNFLEITKEIDNKTKDKDKNNNKNNTTANDLIIDHLVANKRDHIDQKKIAAKELLIIDSIYCLLEISRILEISGITYMVNYSIIAMAHDHVAEWCEYYLKYINSSPPEMKSRIEENLGHLIGQDGLRYITPLYHYEKAKSAYYALFELHGEGKAYRDMIENMYYLNDDFNDTIYHFHAAAERHRINTGKIRKKIKKLKKKLEELQAYKFGNFDHN